MKQRVIVTTTKGLFQYIKLMEVTGMDQLRAAICDCLKTELDSNGGFRLLDFPTPTNGYEFIHFEVVSKDEKEVLAEIIDQGNMLFQVNFKIKRSEQEYAYLVCKYVQVLKLVAQVDASVISSGCWKVRVNIV